MDKTGLSWFDSAADAASVEPSSVQYVGVGKQSIGDSEMTIQRSSPDDILARLVVEAVRHGADELDIEYRDGYEEVCAIKHGMGVGIARLDSSGEEACALREQLFAIGKRGTTVGTGGASFRLRVDMQDSFGDTAYRVRIQRRANQ
jgi:hypothetical protein